MRSWKRWMLLMALVLGLSAALTQGVYAAQGVLPECYRYLLHGAAFAYHDEVFEVYSEPVAGASAAGTLRPGQHIHVETIDRNNGWAYIHFYENDIQEGWNFEEDCLKGWISLSQAVNWDAKNAYAVYNPKAGDRLNLRSGPFASTPALGKYYSGAIALALEAPAKGFVKVRIGHMEGYMDSRYLIPGLVCPAPELPLLRVNPDVSGGMVMRKLPQNGSEVIKTVVQGDVVSALAVRGDGWVQVMYEGETGYAKGNQMNPRLDYQLETGALAGQDLMVSNPRPSERLNLREEPSKQAKSLGKFYSGTPVKPHKTSGSWSYVTIGAQSGWVDSAFLKSPDLALRAAVRVQTHANVTFTQLPSRQSLSTTGFPAGIVIEIYGDLEGEWHYALYGEDWGYIHEEDIERDLNKDLAPENGAAG